MDQINRFCDSFQTVDTRKPLFTDAALQVDDIEDLNLHRPWPCSNMDMMHRALHYKARKCFKTILTERKLEEWNYCELTSLFIKSVKHDYICLRIMVDYGYKDVSQEYGSPLYAATSRLHAVRGRLSRSSDTDPKRFPEHFLETIKLLLSMGADSSATSRHAFHESPLTPLDQLIMPLSAIMFWYEIDKVHIQEIFISAQILLDAMTKEKSEEELPVSLNTVLILHNEFLRMLNLIVVHKEKCYPIIDLCVKILEILLKAGVNLRHEDQMSSVLIPSSCSEQFYKIRTGDPFHRQGMGFLVRDIGRDGQGFEYVMKF